MAPTWTTSKMQKSGQIFSNRSKTILFLQRVRLSKHGVFIFNVTNFETSIFLTRKCSKLLLRAPSNWLLFGDLFWHVSRSISEQQRLQKITILLFLMSSQQGDLGGFSIPHWRETLCSKKKVAQSDNFWRFQSRKTDQNPNRPGT